MGLKLKNDAVSRLASNISSSDTSILLTPGSGVLFPILSSGDYFPVTLIKVDGSHEIVKVTARSTDTLTVVRSQEGTVAQAFNANDRVELRLTSDTFLKQLFQKGDRLLFPMEAAPLGWTQITDDSADNRMMRVVKTAGAGTGGTHSPILNNVVPIHTHGFTTGNQSADHTHSGTTSQVSNDHSHTFSGSTSGVGDHQHIVGISGGQGSVNAGNSLVGDPGQRGGPARYTEGAGAHSHTFSGQTGGISANHTHTVTTGGASSNHTHSGTTDNGSSATNWTPRYIDLILCSRD